jgi:DNA-binding MarR family transcriptional regulator
MLHENLERNFGFLVHDVARLLRVTFDRRVKSMGLTRSQWWVLTHLFRNEGITQAELADLLEVERPTLGRLLDRLESSGWVRREADTTDRRAKRLFLNEAVEPQVRAMRAIAASVRGDALNGLSRDEQEHFVDTLLTIKSNLLALGNGNGTGPVAAEVEDGEAGETADADREVVSQ